MLEAEAHMAQAPSDDCSVSPSVPVLPLTLLTSHSCAQPTICATLHAVCSPPLLTICFLDLDRVLMLHQWACCRTHLSHLSQVFASLQRLPMRLPQVHASCRKPAHYTRHLLQILHLSPGRSLRNVYDVGSWLDCLRSDYTCAQMSCRCTRKHRLAAKS